MTGPRSWTYALITPDGVFSGADQELVARTERLGLHITTCALLTLDVEVMKEVYSPPREGRTRRASGGVRTPARLFKDLYETGPACLFVLSAPTEDAVDRVCRAKGYTRPELADEESVRFTAENIVMNSMHAPDSPEEAASELLLILGDTGYTRTVMRRAAEGARAEPDLDGYRALRAGMPAFTGRDAVSYSAVLVRLLRRLLTHVAARRAPAPPETTGSLRTASAQLDELTTALAREDTAQRRLQMVGRMAPALCERIGAAAAVLDDPLAREVVAELEQLSVFTGKRSLEAIRSAREGLIHVSALEMVVLETHAVSFSAHEDLVGVYE